LLISIQAHIEKAHKKQKDAYLLKQNVKNNQNYIILPEISNKLQ